MTKQDEKLANEVLKKYGDESRKLAMLSVINMMSSDSPTTALQASLLAFACTVLTEERKKKKHGK